MNQIVLRRAVPEDAEAIYKIIFEAMTRYASISNIKGALPSLQESVEDVASRISNDTVLIALLETNPTGTLTIHKISSKRAEIKRFAVVPAIQRTGIGGRLFNEAEKLLVSSGYSEVVLHTALCNLPLLQFYTARGFIVHSESFQSGYKRGFLIKKLEQ